MYNIYTCIYIIDVHVYMYMYVYLLSIEVVVAECLSPVTYCQHITVVIPAWCRHIRMHYVGCEFVCVCVAHFEGFQERDHTGCPLGRSIFTFSSPTCTCTHFPCSYRAIYISLLCSVLCDYSCSMYMTYICTYMFHAMNRDIKKSVHTVEAKITFMYRLRRTVCFLTVF